MPAPIPNGVAESTTPSEMYFHFDFKLFGAAILILIIAQVFALGVKNQEEVESLV